MIPMLEDNYAYYVYDAEERHIGDGFFVDLVDLDKAEQFRKDFKITAPISMVFITHKHPDHSGVIHKLRKAYPDVTIIGGADDDVAGVKVKNGNEVKLLDGEINVRCFHEASTPSTSTGPILYYMDAQGSEDGARHTMEVRDCLYMADKEDPCGYRPLIKKLKDHYLVVLKVNRCVFVGDTLMPGGHGRFLQDDAECTLAAMDFLLELPTDTKILSRHEYTREKYQYCHVADPINPHINKFQFKYDLKDMIEWGVKTVPSNLFDEKQCNVYLRCRTPELQNTIFRFTGIEAMQRLKEIEYEW